MSQDNIVWIMATNTTASSHKRQRLLGAIAQDLYLILEAKARRYATDIIMHII